jgi:uncharacterized protein YecE (DUF72 family)
LSNESDHYGARVGTAGWSLPTAFHDLFPRDGSHLARYASVFSTVEINSSFYRAHLQSTYARWAASVPEDFRFSVKMPKTITHESRLVHIDALLESFLFQIAALGARLGCVLVQLPPSLDFRIDVADSFLATLRERYDGEVAVEPRHPTWFTPAGSSLLEHYRCARVAADPACVPSATDPGGWNGFEYWRLHGYPRIYASAYDDAYLDAMAGKLTGRSGVTAWCIFDNTMFGAALVNGIALQARLRDCGESAAVLVARPPYE